MKNWSRRVFVLLVLSLAASAWYFLGPRRKPYLDPSRPSPVSFAMSDDAPIELSDRAARRFKAIVNLPRTGGRRKHRDAAMGWFKCEGHQFALHVDGLTLLPHASSNPTWSDGRLDAMSRVFRDSGDDRSRPTAVRMIQAFESSGD